jgi:hypothetical protein
MPSRYSPRKVRAILKELSSGEDQKEICRRYGVSLTTLYRWGIQYGVLSRKKRLSRGTTIQPAGALSQLSFCADRLLSFEFPPVDAFDHEAEAADSIEVVNGGVQLYAFVALQHYRELLRALVLLLKARAHPGALVIVPSLFELAAQSYNVQRTLHRSLRVGNLQESWAKVKSLWSPNQHSWPELVREYTEYGGTSIPWRDYADSTEFSHPAPSTFATYCRANAAHICFIEWRELANGRIPLRSLVVATAAICERMHSLLNMANEKCVSAELKRLLVDFGNRGGLMGVGDSTTRGSGDSV